MTDQMSAVGFHMREALAHRAIAAALENGTYDALMAYESAWVPATWVAERLGISAQAANNRLTKLERTGVCRRRRVPAPASRAYEYHWIAKVGA